MHNPTNFLGPLGPGVGSDEKIEFYKMLLEFDFMFYVKRPNSPKIYIFFLEGGVPAHSGSNILGPTPKFKIPLPRLFSPGPKVSKKVCHTPVGQKLREGDRFSGNRLFLAQGCTLEAG